VKPVIGILGNALVMDGTIFPGLARLYVNEDYVISVERAGGLPLMLPIVDAEELAREQVGCVDGLVISGGFDLHPREYGEDPLPLQEQSFPRRDRHDRWAIAAALELGIPIFGICRGIQVLNVYFGGSLYQDMSYRPEQTLQHFHSTKPRDAGGHVVTAAPGSWVHGVLGERFEANSFHHQAVKDLGKGLVVTAVARDGVIEALERPGQPFVAAVQWHPEMAAADGDKAMLGLFENFIEIVKKTQGGTK
jgi:putative glutamine amidotransferase